jgi:hypothetical protein
VPLEFEGQQGHERARQVVDIRCRRRTVEQEHRPQPPRAQRVHLAASPRVDVGPGSQQALCTHLRRQRRQLVDQPSGAARQRSSEQIDDHGVAAGRPAVRREDAAKTTR